jgi:mannose/cellobiose epimerase-like protein (N-acyl-D-glucosamine 2-epimerase family)
MRWASLFLIVLLGGCGPSIDAHLAARGLAIVDSTEAHFRLKSGLYSQHADEPQPANLWPAGVQLSVLNAAAMIDRTRIPRARSFADALRLYRTDAHDRHGYQPSISPRRHGCFYDDNEWIVLALLETHDLTRDKKYLNRAIGIFDFIASGESADLGGGVWWSVQRQTKNTCSNAPAICCALRLYQLTRNEGYLSFARRIYAWTNAKLQDEDGLYFDHVRLDAPVERTKWSYNSAMMIRANCLFYEITREITFLDDARRIALTAEAHWFRESDGALTDGAPFAHLLCESLLFLNRIDGDDRHVNLVRRALAMIPEKDGFHPGRWDERARAGDPVRLIDQASAARAFLVAARQPTMRR